MAAAAAGLSRSRGGPHALCDALDEIVDGDDSDGVGLGELDAEAVLETDGDDDRGERVDVQLAQEVVPELDRLGALEVGREDAADLCEDRVFFSHPYLRESAATCRETPRPTAAPARALRR